MYPTICDPCFNSDHDQCQSASPVEPGPEIICGGWFCICNICKPDIKADWHDHVYAQVRAMKNRETKL